MPLTDRLREHIASAAMMEPTQETSLPRLHQIARRAQSIAVFILFDINDWLIGRFAPDRPSTYPTATWPWIAEVESATDEIREEIEAYAREAPLPHVAAVSGLDPESEEGRMSIPGLTGTWRTVMLFTNGRWIDETAGHFPRTVACFADVHPKSNVGFSALDPRSHIAAHAETNRGALRFQLPLVIPGRPGDCRVRVGDETVHWHTGEAIVFDLSAEHEAWNDTDEVRVLLLAEIAMPLHPPLSWMNRLAQHSYRWHPSYRGTPDRIAAFGREHDRAAEVRTAI